MKVVKTVWREDIGVYIDKFEGSGDVDKGG